MKTNKHNIGIEMSLVSDRLSIRPIKEVDAPQLLKVLESNGLAYKDSFDTYTSYSTAEDALCYIRDSFENDVVILALFQRGEEEKLIGIINLHGKDRDPDCNGKKTLYVDHLVHKKECRTEFLAEAYKNVSTELFEKHNVVMLVFQTYAENQERIRIAEFCGFTRNDLWDDIFDDAELGSFDIYGFTMASPYGTECPGCNPNYPREISHDIGCPK